MKRSTEIAFKTNEFQTRLTDGKTSYQGQIVHNQVLGARETCQLFAEAFHGRMGTLELQYVLETLGEFIRHGIAKGYHMDFGPFTVGIKLRGSFPASNSPFDEKRNSMAVEITPAASIKRALGELKPVNASTEKPRLSSALQVEPVIKDGDRTAYDVIYSDGHRKVQCNGLSIRTHAGVIDEGIWIEDDDGERLAVGQVYSSTYSTCDFTLDEHVDPGVYWLVVQARLDEGPELLRCRHRLTVVANS